MDVISSINSAVTLIQRLKDISKNIEDAEFKNVLADLSLEIADTKLALAKITEDYAELQNEVTSLKHRKGKDTELIFDDFGYYTPEGDGPFCPGCYDTQKNIVRLSKLSGAFTAFGSHTCPGCDKHFGEAM